MKTTDPLAQMHTELTQRPTPERVLRHLSQLGLLDGIATPRLRERAQELSKGRHSAPRDYHRHPGLAELGTSTTELLEALAEACTRPLDVTLPTCSSEADLASIVAAGHKILGLDPESYTAPSATKSGRKKGTPSWSYGPIDIGTRGRRGDKGGHANIRSGYNAEQRRENLPGVSVRMYRRAVRAVCHLEQRLGVLQEARSLEQCIQFGKSRLAHTITVEDFSDSPTTAAFVAYYTARLGLRTLFTNGAQAQPMDKIGEALLDAAIASPDFRPDVVARVLTRRSILDLMDADQKRGLVEAYVTQLVEISAVLDRTFDRKRDRTRMVARPGDDSSTWNAASRAFNQARTGWLNLTHDLGLSDVLNTFVPGKVPALVAGDVAHWHARGGGAEHLDVAAFAKLPLPWDVVLGTASCSAADITRVFADLGASTVSAGWLTGYTQAELAASEPTPELVHGVVVEYPELAQFLRREKVMYGRPA